MSTLESLHRYLAGDTTGRFHTTADLSSALGAPDYLVDLSIRRLRILSVPIDEVDGAYRLPPRPGPAGPCRTTPWTVKADADLRAALEAGASISGAAAAVGRSEGSVQARMERLNLRTVRSVPNTDRTRIRELAATGVPHARIASLQHLPVYVVEHYAAGAA